MNIRERIILFAAEGFGLGMIPVAPGTFGSLWGIPIGWSLGYFELGPIPRIFIWLIMFVVGIPICATGARLRNKKDPGSVVWDEMTAFPLVFALTPVTLPYLIAGFLFFRFFDVLKPWPIKTFEKLPGGLGIMVDDQIAALMAAGCLLLLPLTGIEQFQGWD
ncbi:MAG: phosphatidylglycerophosphatase A [Planctomyces sp.]|nr:phosphatidylglycerophosphatase A [Planctomyces sp.]